LNCRFTSASCSHIACCKGPLWPGEWCFAWRLRRSDPPLCFPFAFGALMLSDGVIPFFLCFIVLPGYEGLPPGRPRPLPMNCRPCRPRLCGYHRPVPQSGTECVTTDLPCSARTPNNMLKSAGTQVPPPTPSVRKTLARKKTAQRTRHCFYFSVVLYCHTCTLIPTIRNATYAPLQIIKYEPKYRWPTSYRFKENSLILPRCQE
jgi:hypothetical protein